MWLKAASFPLHSFFCRTNFYPILALPVSFLPTWLLIVVLSLVLLVLSFPPIFLVLSFSSIFLLPLPIVCCLLSWTVCHQVTDLMIARWFSYQNNQDFEDIEADANLSASSATPIVGRGSISQQVRVEKIILKLFNLSLSFFFGSSHLNCSVPSGIWGQRSSKQPPSIDKCLLDVQVHWERNRFSLTKSKTL